MNVSFVVIFGNPIDGISFFGPFDSYDKAIEYGEDSNGEWWISDLWQPEIT